MSLTELGPRRCIVDLSNDPIRNTSYNALSPQPASRWWLNLRNTMESRSRGPHPTKRRKTESRGPSHGTKLAQLPSSMRRAPCLAVEERA